MKNITFPVRDSAAWAASTALHPIDIPPRGAITEIGIRFNATMSGALASGLDYDDGFWRCLSSLSIVGDINHFLSLNGQFAPRMLALLNAYEMHINPGCVLSSWTEANFSFVFHPGCFPHDPFDTSVIIPASKLKEFQVFLTACAADALDSSNTISSGRYYVWVRGVLQPITADHLMPIGHSQILMHTQNDDDYGQKVKLPTQCYLRRILILSQDESSPAVRVDDQIAGLQVKDEELNDILYEARWEDSKTQAAALYGLVGTGWSIEASPYLRGGLPAGFTIIDFRPITGDPRGLNTFGVAESRYRLGLSIKNYTAGDATQLYFDCLKPVPENLID